MDKQNMWADFHSPTINTKKERKRKRIAIKQS